jgi:hypothetical protein
MGGIHKTVFRVHHGLTTPHGVPHGVATIFCVGKEFHGHSLGMETGEKKLYSEGVEFSLPLDRRRAESQG